MEIREANIHDIENLYLLWEELMIAHQDYHSVFKLAENTKELVTGHLQNLILKPDTKIFVGIVDENIAGMLIASFTIGLNVFVLNKKGYIAETIVKAQHRNSGIGHKLAERAQNWLIEKGTDHIELQVAVKNKSAARFWSGLGFTISTNHFIKEL